MRSLAQCQREMPDQLENTRRALLPTAEVWDGHKEMYKLIRLMFKYMEYYMDKQIKKVQKDVAKDDKPKAKKDLKKLLKMDKKFDKKLDECKSMKHKEKK